MLGEPNKGNRQEEGIQVTEALSASLEDYLEAILELLRGQRRARVKDIAERLGVTMPSVTGALHTLAERGLVNYRPYEAVTLTKRGREAAEGVRRRHEALTTFFREVLGLEARVAEENACRIEHVIDEEVLERLTCYLEFLGRCPLGAGRWVGGFGYFCQHGREMDDCERRLEEALARCRARKKRGGTAMKAVTLDQIEPGQKARIIRVQAAAGPTNRRIVDMGVTPGTLVEVERVAPLGDPIEVKVKGYHLSLRKEEARGISVEALSETEQG